MIKRELKQIKCSADVNDHEPIETKISTIIAMLELEGTRMKIERIESEIRRKKWEEQFSQ